jgi:hypothetical protein
VYEVLSVLNWIAAFVLAQWLAPRAAAMMPLSRAGDAIAVCGVFRACDFIRRRCVRIAGLAGEEVI